mmetsp:Transcript_4958/g.6590  ORF Transcript_4958/g.6590 Transcript_4958/m.6590 type:complete len:100 (-) Transcript_4958:242-541(-)
MSIVDKERLLEATFYTTTGEQIKATPYIVFSFLQQENYLFMAVLFLCVVVAAMLWLFLSYHLYLIKQGWTTNESSKQGYLDYYLGCCEQVFVDWQTLKK